MNYGRIAGAVGVAAGIEAALGASVLGGFAYVNVCNGAGYILNCAYQPSFQLAVGGVGVILLLASVGGILGFRMAFYLEAAAGGLTAVLLLLMLNAEVASYFWSAEVLSLVAAVLSLLSARSRGRLSEQANPMNLPVFG